MVRRKSNLWESDMAKGGKAPAEKRDNLASIPGIHVLEEDAHS